jgi:tRNA dimethylallyltransferase
MKQKAYIIAGPTASGKTDFAHKLALRTGGVIRTSDSVQIYRGIENISASPFAEKVPGGMGNNEIDGIPYRLFSILPLTRQISVSEFLQMASDEYNAALAIGRTPILVGGTGYYINVLLNGISPIPNISDENRSRAREMLREFPDSVKQLLPEDFAVTDPQRTARALEVFLETGVPLTQWQKLPRAGAISPTPYKIFINPPRDVLVNRIAARIPEMMRGGALDEAQSVINSGWDETRAIGASELCRLIRGDETRDVCIKNWITRTNQYAKRQRTWFKNQFDADLVIPHIATDEDIDKLIINNE